METDASSTENDATAERSVRTTCIEAHSLSLPYTVYTDNGWYLRRSTDSMYKRRFTPFTAKKNFVVVWLAFRKESQKLRPISGQWKCKKNLSLPKKKVVCPANFANFANFLLTRCEKKVNGEFRSLRIELRLKFRFGPRGQSSKAVQVFLSNQSLTGCSKT